MSVRKATILFTCLGLLAAPALAGKPSSPEASEANFAAQQGWVRLAEWTNALETYWQDNELTPDQESLIMRALELGRLDAFIVGEDVEGWKATYGEAFKEIMEEALLTLGAERYVKLVGQMRATEHWMLEMSVVAAGICNCDDLCDCADNPPTYSRCHAVLCATYIGGPTKRCQYQ